LNYYFDLLTYYIYVFFVKIHLIKNTEKLIASIFMVFFLNCYFSAFFYITTNYITFYILLRSIIS